jgi:hypothetical protein
MDIHKICPAMFLLALSVVFTCSLTQAAPPQFELYVHKDLTFALSKPIGWQVSTQDHPNGRTILVVDPRSGATAVMTVATTPDTTNNTVAFAAATVQNVRTQVPGLQLAWAKTTNDKKRTVVETHYRNAQGVEKRSRFYFFMDYPIAKSFGYETSAAEFAKLQPTMMSILANLTFLNQTASQDTRSSADTKGASQNRPVELPLAQQRLADGSGSMLVPQGWTLQGGKGKVLCISPDTALGFSYSTADFWGPSSLPYFNSATIPGVLHYAYMKPVEALITLMQQFGSSNFRIEQRWPNAQRAQAAAVALNRRVEVESALLYYTTKNGVPTRGFFDASTFYPLPSGQWQLIFWGVWGPQASFEQYLPTLVKVAGSYQINEQWAANYVQQGLQRLKQQMARTQAAMTDAANSARESSMAAFQERMRSGDYIDYKRTSTIRGEQEWLSEVEGGVLYKSDHWGLSRDGERVVEGAPFNYYNFKGDNPRYNESMTPVDASREVFEKVFGK